MSLASPPDGFQGKDRDEKMQFYFRQHWIRLIPHITLMLMWTIGISILGYTLFIRLGIEDDGLRRTVLCVLLAAFCFTQLRFITKFYRYFLYVIVITDKKVHRIKKTLLCTDDHQSVDLWMLQDIHKVQHGVIQNVLGFGSMILEAQETILRIHFVPRIEQKYQKCMHLRERARDTMNRVAPNQQANANPATHTPGYPTGN